MEDWKQFAQDHPEALPFCAVSSGTADGDYDRMCEVLNNIEGINFICLDVANGYSQFFVEFVAKVRKTFPSHTIMVSVVIQTKNLDKLYTVWVTDIYIKL